MAEPNCGGCRIRVRWSAVYGSAVYGLAVYDLAVCGSAVYGPGHIRARYIRARCMRSRPMRARCILGPLSTGSLHMGPLDTGPLYARPLVKVCHVPASPVCGSLYGSAGPLCAEPLCAASANRTPTQGSFRKSQRVGLQRFADYFRVALCGLRKRTPSPALSSSMNSIPAASSACRMAASLAAVSQ